MPAKIYTVMGFTGTLKEISEHFGINYSTLQSRLSRGWTINNAALTDVDKRKASKIPPVYIVGEFSGTKETIEKMFGISLADQTLNTSDAIIRRIRKVREPKFYFVGKKYKGSLIAISEDFGCPLSELKAGISDGKTVGDILMKGGYFKENK